MTQALDLSNCGAVRSVGRKLRVKPRSFCHAMRATSPINDATKERGDEQKDHTRLTERASWHDTAQPGVQLRKINGPVVQQEFTSLLREICGPSPVATSSAGLSNESRAAAEVSRGHSSEVGPSRRPELV